jgi:16S rRNA (cytidine1402-2'-O)-methyltransferase
MGRLVLVATPIGNLADVSARAAGELAAADVIACEDTRRTGRLLQHLGVPARRLVVVNEHTEYERGGGEVLDLLAAGAVVALVSDAGTPGISDPGERLVRAALDAGHEVTGVPGPTAAVLALVASGLPTGRWVFEGFLPRSGPARAERLAEVAAEGRTVVLYEAPHRLRRTLDDLVAHCGRDRPVAVARELTKLHEEIWRGTLEGACHEWEAREPIGELVLVVGGAPPPAAPDLEEAALEVRRLVAAGVRRKQATDEVAAATGLSRRDLYERSLRADAGS